MGLELFNESDSDNSDISKIEINHEYAKRYEHNKKREDLHRFEELKKKGIIHDSNSHDSESESSSSEDEDNNALFKKDLEFFDALIKIKKHDPTLKQKDVKLFDSDDESTEGEDKNGIKANEKEIKKKNKSMYLKDVVAKHLIEEGPEFMENEASGVKSYNQEQEEIQKAFLEAVKAEEGGNAGDDAEGEVLLKLKESKNGKEEDENDDGEYVRKLDEYFGGEEGQLDENSRFLKEYFMNKLWLDKDKGKEWRVEEEELKMVMEDEAEIVRQEEYEFRFQENAGDRILGHNRTVEGSVRKKKSSRNEQRKSKEERMEIARIERDEELKHLKNLKKKEVKEKLNRIRETAGIKEDEVCFFDAKDLDEEFDPEEYDRMMKKAFGDEYYDDADSEFGSDRDDGDDGEIEKPDFDKEDELFGLPKGWDTCGSTDGFCAARERILKHKMDNDKDHGDEEEDEEQEEEDDKKGKRKRKRKLALYKKAKEAMMEEYYKLDYEDTIGDLKTRFKYHKTASNRYSLSAAEILAMDDKELNQYVSLKKLAPYKEKEWKVPNSTRYRMKMRAKELMKGGKSDSKNSGEKKSSNDGTQKFTSATEDDKAQNKESISEMGNLSRKARRKLRHAELKLSNSRLMAYGKIPSIPKKKAKH